MVSAETSPMQIRRIDLQSIQFRRGQQPPSTDRDELSYKLGIQQSVKIHDEDSSEALVKLSLKIDWETDNPPFELAMTYLAFVSQDGSLSDEDFKGRCRSRVAESMLSQIRPFVSRLMFESGKDFRLPLLDLNELSYTSEQAAW